MDSRREELLYQLGRESADEWLDEQDELANLEWFQELGDTDLVQYTRGRLSTLQEESECLNAEFSKEVQS